LGLPAAEPPGGGGLEPPPPPDLRRAPEAPPRPEVEEEEGKGGWRKNPAAGAPLAAGAGFATGGFYNFLHPSREI
jgi:hypothetical protein